jgi:putative transposase
MVRYRRNFIPGGTFFFTVTLADRRSSALVDHVDALRAAFRAGRRERPLTVDAIVILPEHLHTIFTLPAGDADFSGRWRRIKGHFSNHMITVVASAKRHPNGDYALWQRRFWEHTIRHPARRLHSFQPRETWPRITRPRLAVFVVPSLRARGIVGRRLGGRRV